MATTQVQPSQAERLEAEAEAGPGANMSAANVDNEKATNDSGTPSEESDAVVEAKVEPPEAKRTKANIALLMTALGLAVFLAALDSTIMTTALPTISAHYHASEADYAWIGSAYLLAAAAATPLWGKVSDIFGRKPILLVANVIFFVGSLICAVSVSIKMLLAGRVIQGIGGGGLLILVNICISDLFSLRTRGVYFGIIGMVWALASALGPVLGGVFTSYVSWRWCFYINLPCDGLAFIILLIFLDIETPKTPIVDGLRAIDWTGSLFIIGGTVMFLFGLEFGGVTFPWASATVICLIVFGIAVIGLFFVNEGYIAKYPIMPLRLFKRRSNIAAFAICFVHGFVFISGSYYLPLYFQAVLGASPLLSGIYILPFVLSLSLTAAGAGIFIRKTGQYRPPIWFGLVLMTIGFGLYINFPSHASWPRIIIFQIIAGLGVGPNFQAPLIALQSLIEPRDIATATATFGFTRNLATSISIVVGGVIFQNGMAKRQNTILSSLPPSVSSELGGGSAAANTALVDHLPPSQRSVATEAYTQSLRTMWIFYTCMAVVGLAASFAIGKQQLSQTHEVTKTGLDAQERARVEVVGEEKLRREEKRRNADVKGALGKETVGVPEEV